MIRLLGIDIQRLRHYKYRYEKNEKNKVNIANKMPNITPPINSTGEYLGRLTIFYNVMANKNIIVGY